MGGGNGAKSATKRARAMEKAAKAPAGSQLKDNAASLTIACKICLQTFVCTTTEKVLRDHWENRHPKQEFFAAFPHLKPA
mmetsp:Transcript_23671/g.60456  ORF Transcript_23671/g.60456 Transcript_23671/m.60456 type:complete len:80 (-) Transcript_23671:291-530(-)|eukprot:CAMPEP_0202868090 /NCGR_PEP_ID=MMETSP1391-20130828/10184_1 /ASSEMBLY_ACC=CAM_ASM_000867 /TAXON_ID=1034604 /ORGANISM="Chlamydomonas leiostraca, Strain SAG 11-49" /LENGTH=79 /DNA_ID=CAMNT_0049548205 /DNA_START=109 /DNA_END=348 /DNA_ORIENTATION=+